MPIPAITMDDAKRIRANLERSGRPVPPALMDATDEPPAPPPAPVKPAKSPAAAKPAAAPAKAKPAKAPATPKQPAAQRGAAGPTGPTGPAGPAGRGRQVAASVGTRAQRSGGTAGKRFRSVLRSPSTLGGSDGGGLLLTFWLYPLVLAIVQEGPKGPGIWLRAKFLNIGTAPPATTKWTAPAAADIGPTKPLPASTANATPAPRGGSTPSAPAPGATPRPAPGKAV